MAIKQTYCAPVTLVPDYLVAVGTVPAGKVYTAGMIVDASVISTLVDPDRNYSVYALAAPVNEKATPLGIIINGGFEQLPDGRRPEGNPDYTQYTYKEGEVVTIVFLADHLRFQISQDALAQGATPVVGQYLNAAANQNLMTADVTKKSMDCFKVEALKFLRTGGIFGAGNAQAYIVSASTHNTIV